MDKNWFNKKIKEEHSKVNKIKEKVKKVIEDEVNLTKEQKEELWELYHKDDFGMIPLKLLKNFAINGVDYSNQNKEKYEQFGRDCIELMKYHEPLISMEEIYEMYLDSEEVEFNGDILITDPCYIIKENTDDWKKTEYGQDMSVLGLKTFITHDTIFGDWSCITFNTDTKKTLGQFCADAGLVGVFLLDEVLKYNPSFDCHLNKPWTTTWIKNFKGTVQIVVKENGKSYDRYSVYVIGNGVNKETGNPINFRTKQTR